MKRELKRAIGKIVTFPIAAIIALITAVGVTHFPQIAMRLERIPTALGVPEVLFVIIIPGGILMVGCFIAFYAGRLFK